MTFRAIIFWLKDLFFDKSKIRKALDDVALFSDEGTENLLQRDRLLRWVGQEVPFYESYKDLPFEKWPVVNKNIIKTSQEMFMARCMMGKKLHTESTSGSTGTPFEVSQDSGKRLRAAADSLYFSELAGFHLGTRLYYVRVWNHINHKSIFQTLMKNIVMVSSDNLSDKSLETFLETLEKDGSEKSVLAYASSVTALYRWMLRRGRKTTAKVSCFITMSESCPEEVKRGISELFNCPVYCRYSNQECGLISQQCCEGAYHINTGSFYVEILDLEKDEPAREGVLGRIVVTDLYNKAMPMIRYDTGDLGILSHVCKCGRQGKVLKSVEGRRVDFITATNGDLLSPVTIINTMWEYQDLIQWQFIQYGKSLFELKLNSTTIPYVREKEILDDIKGIVGCSAQINITYVDEIPLLASGKRKSVLNNMYNSQMK